MSKLKVPDIVPSIVIDNYDMFYETPDHSPTTTITSEGSNGYEEKREEPPLPVKSVTINEEPTIPIKLSIFELHNMVERMMMQRYNITPRENIQPSIQHSPSSPASLNATNSPHFESLHSKEFARRASHVILELPASIAVGGLKKIAHNKNMGSMSRETNHFCGITTVHGPNRIYNGKGVYRYLWMIWWLTCLALLMVQIVLLCKDYFSYPISTNVEMTMDPDGLTFPTITICNYNAIRKSYVDEINKTGDFSNLLLNYITLSNLEVQFINSINNSNFLKDGNAEFESYKNIHPDFSVDDFYLNAGFNCSDMLKICSFGGREFDCCSNVLPVLTDMGKCFRIQLDESAQEWLHTQKLAGINNGLQIVVDTNTDEQINSSSIYKFSEYIGQPIFANQLAMGLRFYVHIPRDLPHLVGDGISVSPGGIIYSSITPTQYTLLAKDSWGNCIEAWPNGIPLDGDYSSARCIAYCRANYFAKTCGCSPFVYDLDEVFTPCTPLKLYECVKNVSQETLDQSLKCSECGIECERWAYSVSNSYDYRYAPGAYEWLATRNQSWSSTYVGENFATLNIFYKELVYSALSQSQGSNMVVLLSNIGGNMGMFVGMSLLSCTEVIIFLCKITWILISKKRRNYLQAKKDKEKEDEKKLELTLKTIKLKADKAALDNETKLTETLTGIKNQAVNAAKKAEEDEHEHEERLTETLTNIKNQALIAVKKAEEEARAEKEKSVFSHMPVINAKIHHPDDIADV